MKSRNALVFFVALLFAVAVNFSQVPLTEPAGWAPTGIGVSPATLVEGTAIVFSATLQVFRNVRGLKYEAGVDGAVLQEQSFPGELVAGTSMPLKFSWKAVRGRHAVFFRLIMPGASRRPLVKKLDKTINVVPRQQTPGLSPLTPAQTLGEPDECYGQQKAPAKVKIEEFSAQYTPANHLVIYSYTIYNDSPRCIRELYLYLRYEGNDRLADHLLIDSERPGGWALKTYQRRSLIGSFTPTDEAMKAYPDGWSYPCQKNPQHKCLRLKLDIRPTDPPGSGESKTIWVDVGLNENNRG